MRDLTTAEQEYLYRTSPDNCWIPGNCPFCGAVNPWLEGPRGGLAINLKCEQCHTKINWCGPLSSQLIELGDNVPSVFVADIAPPEEPEPESLWTRFKNVITRSKSAR